MKYSLLQQLLPLLERYESSTARGKQSLGAFLRFASHVHELEMKLVEEDSEEDSEMPSETSLNALIARDISFVYRYMRYFVRKGIKDSPLQTIDEYSYLMTLMARGRMSKTELNNYNVIEKTSGGEIIRRLLRQGLITQSPHPLDKRSVLISLTPQGRQVLMQVVPYMQLSSDLLLRDLTHADKTLLHALHKRINDSNEEIFFNQRDSDLEEISRQYDLELPSFQRFSHLLASHPTAPIPHDSPGS